MKKILFLLIACIAMTACKKDDDKPKVELDPYSSIILNGETAAPQASTKAQFAPPYTIQTVTKYARDIAFTREGSKVSISILERDIEAGKIRVGQADEVVRQNDAGDIVLGSMVQGISDMLCRATFKENIRDEWWIDGDGGVAQGTGPSGIMDTLAYVPNAVIRKAEADIKVAFDAGDYAECMRLFEKAYVFVPTTGKEWIKLKDDGIE